MKIFYLLFLFILSSNTIILSQNNCGTKATQDFSNFTIYNNTPILEAPIISQDFSIYGSENIFFRVGNGLGLGSKAYLNAGDTLTVKFNKNLDNAGAAVEISWLSVVTSCAIVASVQAYDLNGNSIGEVSILPKVCGWGTKPNNVSELFGDVPISKFKMIVMSGTGSFSLTNLKYTMICKPDPVPTLSQWGLFLLSLCFLIVGTKTINQKYGIDIITIKS